MQILSHGKQFFQTLNPLQKFAFIFLFFNGIYYWPLSIVAGFGPQHILLMLAMIIVGVCVFGMVSRALIIGSIYFLWELLVVGLFSDSIRWSTIIYSFGLIFTYVGFYHLVYCKKVFTIDTFIVLMKAIMLTAFVVCILQQLAILTGIRHFPLLNLIVSYQKKGLLACNSLYQEMSTFARFMFTCYYGYIRCNEIRRGQGRLAFTELFKGEHRWVTIRFLWMMLTMGSGTAIICLLAFSLYFITRKNAFYIVPLFVIGYLYVGNIEHEQLQRSLYVIEAVETFDRQKIIEADKSAAFRITPLINSLNADFSKKETWFGHGVDYAKNNRLVLLQRSTMFDDYGVVLYLLGLIFTYSCVYKINSFETILVFLGCCIGLGGNIQYGWQLAMIMTVIRFFLDEAESASRNAKKIMPLYENRISGKIYENDCRES